MFSDTNDSWFLGVERKQGTGSWLFFQEGAFSFSCQVQGGDSCLDKGCFPLFLGNRTLVCSVATYAGSRDKLCSHQGN